MSVVIWAVGGKGESRRVSHDDTESESATNETEDAVRYAEGELEFNTRRVRNATFPEAILVNSDLPLGLCGFLPRMA